MTGHTAEQVEFVKQQLASGRKAQSRRSWDEYRARFGDVSYDSYAHFARDVRDGKEIVGRVTTEPTLPTVEAVSAQERRRMQEQAEREMYATLRKKQAIEDEVVERILDRLPLMPAMDVPVLSAPAVDSRPQTAMLLLSDLHVGNRVSREETGGLGEYGYPIFQRRLGRLSDAVRSITAHHRKSHPVPRLVMPWLGDMIENVEIFPSQLEEVDLDLSEQVLNCVADLAKFTVGLLDTFETIFVPVVTGNHGRIGRKGQHVRHINWDYIIAKFVERELKPYADRIQFEIPKSVFAVIEVEGYTWLLRHGDGIKQWMGMPYYGIERSVGRWTAIFAKQRTFFDYMAMGHFHTSTDLNYSASEVIVNGAFPGPTAFNVEVIERLSEPMQFFGMMHPRYGLAARYPILLDPRSR